MNSPKFPVNDVRGREEAVHYSGEQFAQAAGLTTDQALRFRLLTEETLGMVAGMVNQFYGQVWFSAEELCEIHVDVTANLDPDMKEEVLSVATDGKNAARGFFGRIAEAVSRRMHAFGKAIDASGASVVQYGLDSMNMDMVTSAEMIHVWDLRTWRDGVGTEADLLPNDASAQADPVWDELEKSVVASMADNVIVGVKGNVISLIVQKKF